MKSYLLSATYQNQTTSQVVPARNTFSAKVSATRIISANHVSDKRYAKGEITLKDPEGKVIWNIKSEEEQKK